MKDFEAYCCVGLAFLWVKSSDPKFFAPFIEIRSAWSDPDWLFFGGCMVLCTPFVLCWPWLLTREVLK